MLKALVLAAVAATAAAAYERVEIESDRFSAIVTDLPSIEFWDAEGDRPRRWRDRNFLRPAWLRECTSRWRCRRTHLRTLDWELPTDFSDGTLDNLAWENVAVYKAQGNPAFHNFESIELDFVLGVCPTDFDSGDVTTQCTGRGCGLQSYPLVCNNTDEATDSTVGFGFTVRGYAGARAGARMDFIAWRSRNSAMRTAAGTTATIQQADVNLPLINNIEVSDRYSRRRRIVLSFDIPEETDVSGPISFSIRLDMNLEQVGAIGGVVAGCAAAAAFIVVAGVAFRAYKVKKDEKDQAQEWDEVEIALPTKN